MLAAIAPQQPACAARSLGVQARCRARPAAPRRRRPTLPRLAAAFRGLGAAAMTGVAMTAEVHEFFLAIMGMGILASLASGTAHGLQQAVGTQSAVLAAALQQGCASGDAPGRPACGSSPQARHRAVSQLPGPVREAQMRVQVGAVRAASLALGALITAAHVMERLVDRAADAVQKRVVANGEVAEAVACSAEAFTAAATSTTATPTPAVAPAVPQQQHACGVPAREVAAEAAPAGEKQELVAVFTESPAVEAGWQAQTHEPRLAPGRQMVVGSWHANGPLAAGRQLNTGSWGWVPGTPAVALSGPAAVEAASAVELAAAAVQLAHAAVEVAEAAAAQGSEGGEAEDREELHKLAVDSDAGQQSVLSGAALLGAPGAAVAEHVLVSTMLAELQDQGRQQEEAPKLAGGRQLTVGSWGRDGECGAGRQLIAASWGPHLLAAAPAVAQLTPEQDLTAESAVPVVAQLVAAHSGEVAPAAQEVPNGDAVRPGLSVEEATKDVEGWIAAWTEAGSAAEQVLLAGEEAARQPSGGEEEAHASASVATPSAAAWPGVTEVEGSGEQQAGSGASDVVAQEQPQAGLVPVPAAPIIRVTEPWLPSSAAAVLAAITAYAPVAATPKRATEICSAGPTGAPLGLPAGAAAPWECQVAANQGVDMVEVDVVVEAGLAVAVPPPVTAPVPMAVAVRAPLSPVPAEAVAADPQGCPTLQQREAAYKARIAAVLAESKLAAAQGQHAPAAAVASSGLAALAPTGAHARQVQPHVLRAQHLAMRSKGVDCLQGAPRFRAVPSYPVANCSDTPPSMPPARRQQHEAQQAKLLARSNRILQNLAEQEAAERRRREAEAPEYGGVANLAHRAWQVLLRFCLLVLARLTAALWALRVQAGQLADCLAGISDTTNAVFNPTCSKPSEGKPSGTEPIMPSAQR